MTAPTSALIVGLALVLLAAVAAAAPPSGDEFVRSLDGQAAGVVDNELLGDLAKYVYKHVLVGDDGKLVVIDQADVKFAIHEEMKSWKNILSDIVHLRPSKEKRVRAIQSKHKAECEKVQGKTAPLLEQLAGLTISSPTSLSDSGKKLLAVAKICSVVLSKAGDQIYNFECSRAKI